MSSSERKIDLESTLATALAYLQPKTSSQSGFLASISSYIMGDENDTWPFGLNQQQIADLKKVLEHLDNQGHKINIHYYLKPGKRQELTDKLQAITKRLYQDTSKPSSVDLFEGMSLDTRKQLYDDLVDFSDDDAWYQALHNDLTYFTKLLQPSSQKIASLPQQIDTIYNQTWPYGLKAEENILLSFLSTLNELSTLLQKHGNPTVPTINITYYQTNKFTRIYLANELSTLEASLAPFFKVRPWRLSKKYREHKNDKKTQDSTLDLDATFFQSSNSDQSPAAEPKQSLNVSANNIVASFSSTRT